MNNSLNEPDRSRSDTLYGKVNTPMHFNNVVRRGTLIPTHEVRASLRRLLQMEVTA